MSALFQPNFYGKIRFLPTHQNVPTLETLFLFYKRPLPPHPIAAHDELIPSSSSFSPQKFTFSAQSIVYTLFLKEDGRNLKNGLSKLHYRFRRYSILTKTVLLESQYLQSYDSLPDFLRPKFEEDRQSRFVITLQNCLRQSWISSKSIMQLTETFFLFLPSSLRKSV